MNIPVTTYRIQFNKTFTFTHAHENLAYLHALGVSDLYASPIFEARPDSMHGYDVTSPHELNPELGGEKAFSRLSELRKSLKMGWLQDIVPNHMAYHSNNKMLMDVLENGRESSFSKYFDINWNAHQPNFKNKILAPFLGKPFGYALQEGEIKLGLEEDALKVFYYDMNFPLNPGSYKNIMALFSFSEEFTEHLKSLLKDLQQNNVGEPYRNIVAQIKDYVQQALRNKDFKENLQKNINKLSEDEDKRILHRLLQNQHYQLCYWKVAGTSNNYRRFFTINDLISLRADNKEVFEGTHKAIIEKMQHGDFTGLRIDHIDGLYYPVRYLRMLRSRIGKGYIVVEKILEAGEKLPKSWPVEGTSGYDYMVYANNLFCDENNYKSFLEHYHQIHPEPDTPPEDRIAIKKENILLSDLNSSLENLVELFQRPIWHQVLGADASLAEIKNALTTFLCYMPVYRTYINPRDLRISDKALILETLEICRQKKPDLNHVFSCLEDIFLLKWKGKISPSQRDQVVHGIMRLQQLSGPLMAKGVEDTLFYTYYPLLSVNEVGGSPFSFGDNVESFHKFYLDRSKQFPYAMNASATHDTKRGEDNRARLNVLSEIPEQWFGVFRKWQEINRRHKAEINDQLLPDENTEYALYQTLLGTFPPEPHDEEEYQGRIKEYMLKFVKEAKVHTSWIDPDEIYENILKTFITNILQDTKEFIPDFLSFLKKIAFYGYYNSLSQLALKAMVPGVPDFYQGTELWDFSLVDPDNRRPVNYQLRKEYLNEITPGATASQLVKWLNNPVDGKIKFYLTRKLMQFRRSNEALMTSGKYIPVEVQGEMSAHAVAFIRAQGKRQILVVVLRLYTRIIKEHDHFSCSDSIKKTRLYHQKLQNTNWKNIFTGQKHQIKGEGDIFLNELIDSFPVGIFTNFN